MWDGEAWVNVPVPMSDDEAIVVPNTAAIVFSDESKSQMLLQRRDKDYEPVRGLLEIPAGRWRAGEDPWQALRREVAEETGLDVQRTEGRLRRHEAQRGRPFISVDPISITIGVEGAYPALVIAFVCIASGTPRPQDGETKEPRWYDVAEVLELLKSPSEFTGPTYAILMEYFEGGEPG